MPKTFNDVEFLKQNWYHDPHWDIEDTEGFEEHHDELLAYRQMCEKDWQKRLLKKINAKALELGCSPRTAEYVLCLEIKLLTLEERLDKRIDNLAER